jgi:hypothetical protein
MKNLIYTTFLFILFTLPAFANGIKEWESFRKMSYEKQVEVIDKLQQLVISIETNQRKLIKSEVRETERNKLKQQLEKMLIVMSNIFIEKAHAEDYAKTCMFAGWLADYSKVGNAVFCNISDIKSKSGNYKTNFTTPSNKAPTNSCTGNGQVPCQPMLFGTDKNGKLFCVNQASSGAYYTSASTECRKFSQNAKNYGDIIRNILKNPKDFLDLVKAIQKLCLCDTKEAQNTNEYKRIILKDGTCQSLVQQLKYLFDYADPDKPNLTCSPEALDLFTGLKDVMPVVKAFDMNKKFLDERKRICDENQKVVVVPPIETPKEPKISIALGVPSYSADKITAEVKVTAVECPGLTIKNNQLEGTDKACEVNWVLKSNGNDIPDPNNKNKIAKTITLTAQKQTITVKLTYKGKSVESSQDIDPINKTEDPGISIALGVPSYSTDKITAEVKITAVECPGLTIKNNQLEGTDKGCEVNWVLKSNGNDIPDPNDKNKIAKTITLTAQKQTITVKLTYKGKSVESSQDIDPINKTDDPGISITLGAPDYSATNSAEVKITSVTCPGLTKPEEIGKPKTECIITWFTKDVEASEVKTDGKPEPTKDFGENPDDLNVASFNVSLKDKEQLVTVVLTYRGKTASSSQSIKKLEKSEDDPTPTPTPSPSPTPESDEADDPPIPLQQQPQIPFGEPMQPMLLPGVI